MSNVKTWYWHDRKLCSIKLFYVVHFLARGHAFIPNYSCCVSRWNSPVSSYPTPRSNSHRLDKRGLILSTPGVSGQQPPTTFLPLCLLLSLSLSLYIYIYIYISVCLFHYVHIHISISNCSYIYICICVCVSMSVWSYQCFSADKIAATHWIILIVHHLIFNSAGLINNINSLIFIDDRIFEVLKKLVFKRCQ